MVARAHGHQIQVSGNSTCRPPPCDRSETVPATPCYVRLTAQRPVCPSHDNSESAPMNCRALAGSAMPPMEDLDTCPDARAGCQR
jgi:hypothetical protein